MEAIYPNSSYVSNFQGPSLQCRSAARNETRYPDMFVQQLARNLSYVYGTPEMVIWNDTMSHAGYQAYNVTPVFVALSGSMGYMEDIPDYFESCVLTVTTSDACNFWFANTSRKKPLPALFLLLQDQTWSCSIQVTNFSTKFQSTESEQSIDPEYSYEWVADWHTWRPDNDSIITGDFYSGFWITQALIDSVIGIVGVEADKRDDFIITNLIQFGEARIKYNSAYSLISHALNETNSRILAEAGVPYYADGSTSMNWSPEEETLTRNLSLGSLVEEYSRNLTLSLFSQSRFWCVYTMVPLRQQDPKLMDYLRLQETRGSETDRENHYHHTRKPLPLRQPKPLDRLRHQYLLHLTLRTTRLDSFMPQWRQP